MDKQGRLDKWEEWIIGDWYFWKKGRINTKDHPRRCVEVNKQKGFVRFNSNSEDIIRFHNWKKRFIHIEI